MKNINSQFAYETHQLMEGADVRLSFSGEFSPDLITVLLSMAKSNIGDKLVMKKVYNVMIECLENLTKHSLKIEGDQFPAIFFVLSSNTEGKLYFKDATGRGVVYHNDPEKSAAAHIAPGIFTLGEIAYMDPDGYVYITDRFSDMIVSGGVNIYPAEAEQVLIDHPQILDVACIGIPHPVMGEELKAMVILKDDTQNAQADEVIAFCRDRLSHYKCPRTVDFVEDLGRNTMGKINKRKLREPFWAAQQS